jgi:hypothetical protein
MSSRRIRKAGAAGLQQNELVGGLNVGADVDPLEGVGHSHFSSFVASSVSEGVEIILAERRQGMIDISVQGERKESTYNDREWFSA